jgi:hypothetical protein
MKHKDLIIRKLNELKNSISVQESSISRLEPPEILKDQLQKLRYKINEMEILINNEDQQQF